MRGEVLHYDEAQGFGFISGSDGNSYSFRREDLRRVAPMPKGTAVEFEPNGGQARGIFTIRAMGQTSGVPLHPAQQQFGRSAIVDQPATPGLWGYFQQSLTVNYATFRGRARRKEYWGYFLFWTIGLFAITGAAVAIDAAVGNLYSNNLPIVTILAVVIFFLGTLLPSLAVTVRRIHDIGLSGWFYLLVLVPYVGSLIVFVFSLIPTQTYPNKWGPVPDGIRIPPPYQPDVTPTAT